MTSCIWCSTSRIVRSYSRAQREEQLRQLADLPVAEAAGGLVEQQQLRPRRQRARQLDALERAVGEPAAGRSASPRLEPGEVRPPLASALGLAATRGSGEKEPRPAWCAPTITFSSTRQRAEEREVLERARDPERGRSRAARAQQVLAVEDDRARVRAVRAG